ncbi:hypothetical protein EK599_10950 [Vibrio sp. T187]|uniref:hypothetical protein n=1 Tax=Vibrio TaxID=662 RepID=UPI0010C9896C|nr:hypothetical protein [Vibrio sp. T187]MBW3696218.1 hypothetical protein [Vibrio sp. T187]
MKNTKTAPNNITCPLCQHDEYMISESGEKFTCASCGFHTKHFTSITRGFVVPIDPQPQSAMHLVSRACH